MSEETPETHEGEAPEWLAEWKGEEIPKEYVRPTLQETLSEVAKAHGSLRNYMSKTRKQGDDPPKEDPADPVPEPKPPKNTEPPGDPLKLGGGDAPEPTHDGDPPEDPNEIVEAAGLDWTTIGKKFNENGQLDAGDYEAIIKVNGAYSKPLVDSLARGAAAEYREVLSEQQTIYSSLIQLAGSKEALEAMFSRAREYVPADEFDDIQRRFLKKGPHKGAWRDLKEHYDKWVGADGSRAIKTGSAPPATHAKGGFTSIDEYRKAQQELDRQAQKGKVDPSLLARLRATDRDLLTDFERKARN